MKSLLLILLISSCGRPFLTGKKHRLVLGTPEVSYSAVYVTDYKVANSDSVFVKFVNLDSGEKDSVVLKNVKEFNRRFKYIKE